MQKPQQRKYHSSCNRSVHRGTAHGRQRVKICKRKTPHLLVRSFLSPYGDKLQSIAKLASAIARFALSSPYGDGTKISIQTATIVQFSPPTGMVPTPQRTTSRAFSFRPLTGMVPEIMSNTLTRYRFRPLTGMVPGIVQRPRGITSFRPLTGMVLWMPRKQDCPPSFSPPYGDSTLNISQNIVKWKS